VIDSDALNIWHQQRLVGTLWRTRVGYIGFRYDPDWIAGGGFAVSRSLPLRTDDFAADDGIAQRFFANLLPEGAVREHIVRDLKLPNTDFDLLRAIGGECAGALSILPVDRRPSGQRHYHPLTEDELANLAARRGQIYAAWRDASRTACAIDEIRARSPITHAASRVKKRFGSGGSVYHWDSDVVFNAGAFIEDMGDDLISVSEDAPAAHMMLTITRMFALMDLVGFGEHPSVGVTWPTGENSHYTGQFDSIRITLDSTWEDDTYVHEFGHHWMATYGSVGPWTGYCNPGGRCMDNPAQNDCGHCLWCEESTADAWREGVPDFLASWYFRIYSMSQLYDPPPLSNRQVEEHEVCPASLGGFDEYDNPNLTEGAVAGLLWDLEDGSNFDGDIDDRSNGLGMDVSDYSTIEIFECIFLDAPTSGNSFLSAFLARHPGDGPELWRTAYNNGFNIDGTPPGVVTGLTTTSHSLVGDSPDGTIDFRWTPATDDLTPGSLYYSVWIGTSPQLPDTGAEIVGFEGQSFVALTTGDLAPGSYYFSVRAADWAGNWSPDYASFGPITIREYESADLVATADPLWDFPLVPTMSSLPAPPIHTPPILTSGPTYLQMQVYNSGEVATTGTLEIVALLDGDFAAVQLLTPGAPIAGESYVSWLNNGPATVLSGRHTLTLVADYTEQLREWNEADNWFIKQWIWRTLPIRQTVVLNRTAPPLPFAGWQSPPPLGSANCWGIDLELPDEGFVAVALRALSNEDDYDLRLFPDAGGPESGYLAQSLVAFSNQPAGSIDALVLGAENLATDDWDVGILNSNGFLVGGRNESDLRADVIFSEAIAVGVPKVEYLTVGEVMDLYHFSAEGAPANGRVKSFAVELDAEWSQGQMRLSLFDEDSLHENLEGAYSSTSIDSTGLATLYIDGTVLSNSFGVAVHRDPPPDGFSNGQDSYTLTVRSANPDYLAGAPAGWAGPLLPMSSLHNDPDTVPEPAQLGGDAAQYLQFSLENLTSADAATVDSDFLLDGVIVSSLQQTPLEGPGTSPVLNHQLAMVPGGRHTLGVCVDAPDLVGEEDETNNGFADQWVFIPPTMAIGSGATRAMPPDPAGGIEDATSLLLYPNSDGLRLPQPAPSGDDGHWLALAALPDSAADVDLLLHEAATSARDGFEDSEIRSTTGPGLLEFVAINFRATPARPMDAGVVKVEGSTGYDSHLVESSFLDARPAGDYGDFSMGRGVLIQLHEVYVERAEIALSLIHLSGDVDWGLSVLRANTAFHARTTGDSGNEEWLAPSGSGEVLTLSAAEEGYYCIAVWKADAASVNNTGEYRLDFGSAQPFPTPTPALQRASRLSSIQPNPFNPATTIEFELRNAGPTKLILFDVRGRRIRTLVDEILQAGTHRRRWDGRAHDGQSVASGVYFVQLIAGESEDRKRMTLLK